MSFTRASLVALLSAVFVVAGCGARTPIEVPEDVPSFTDAVDRADARDVGDVPILPDGADVRDVPDVTDVPIPTGCMVNADCAGTPATPVCDTLQNICVECLPMPDNCPRGRVCDGSIHHCVPGCRSDADCGGATPVCRNDTHECVECTVSAQCPGRGAICRNFQCSRPCNGMCPGGETCCDNFCASTNGDPSNCGGCGIVCAPVVHGTNACLMASCGIGRCDPGFGDCDNRVDSGCETNLANDSNNCGGCGVRCGANEVCTGGRCTRNDCATTGCVMGLACCADACTPILDDPNNCGGCGIACNPIAHGSAACATGRCTVANCDRGFGDCDSIAMNGCETDLQSDNLNCGSCGRACPGDRVCSAGLCVPRCGTGAMCPPGTQCCGSTCAITSSDVNNCGMCGNVCPPLPNATPSCNASTCSIGACTRGFANCDGVVGNGCEANLGADVNNCGGCNVRCAPGASCVNGSCTAAPTCPAVPCGMGQACCGGTCRDITGDPMNCGGCNVACSSSTPICMNGACCSLPDAGGGVCGAMVCPGTQTNCGGVCVSLDSDPNNCGGCDIRCTAGQTCMGGFCRGIGPCMGGCSPATTCCGDVCVSTSSDTANCGGCGITCPSGANSRPTCTGSMCGIVCAPGFGDCDGSAANGCESNLGSSTSCGMCGVVCAAGSTCTGGRCVVMGCNGGPACSPGRTCCTSGCSDTTSDTANCGACGRACNLPNASSSCTASTCTIAMCNAGFDNCDGVGTNGCETNLQTDIRNCGACGMACASGLTCVMGRCTMPSDGSEGAFLPTVNPTYLTPGIHNFTTITVPAGSVVYVAGAGANAGTLDLRATGHIQIDGTIDVSGGDGTQAIVASRSTQLGRGGTGGYTGEVRSAAMAAMNCEFATGSPGPNGPAVMGSAGTCTVLGATECITRSDPRSFIFTAPIAQYGGGAGVFTGYRAYGSGGGGYAGGAGGALGATFGGEADCSGVTGGGGARGGNGGRAMSAATYDGANGTLGQTQCDAVGGGGGVPRAWVGGGGGGSIGTAAAADLPAASTFYPGSGGGGGSADYLQRPAFGGTSGGGGGGGVLRLWTPVDITVTGSLLANGGAGGDAYLGTPASAGCDPQPGSAGGGGSGGLIYLIAPSISSTASARVSAVGGVGGDASVFATGGSGGAGGVGRIRISVTPTSCTLAGTFAPALVSGCTPAAARAGSAYLAAYPN